MPAITRLGFMGAMRAYVFQPIADFIFDVPYTELDVALSNTSDINVSLSSLYDEQKATAGSNTSDFVVRL